MDQEEANHLVDEAEVDQEDVAQLEEEEVIIIEEEDEEHNLNKKREENYCDIL